jgi:hypothetical protein
MIRAGGWGPVFGDEGGGFWIGREAIRCALRAKDSGEAAEFVSAIEKALGLSRITDAPAHGRMAPSMFGPLQHSHLKLSVVTPRIRPEESSIKPLHTSEASAMS